MRMLLALIPLLLLGACSSPEQKPDKPDTSVPKEIVAFVEAQQDGRWEEFCQLLAPTEAARIKRTLSSKSCASAVQKKQIADNLQRISRTMRLQKIKKTGSAVRADFTNPEGTLWLQDGRIYYSSP